MKLCKMIEIYLKYDNMNTIRTINAFICINNQVNSCINSLLSYTSKVPLVLRGFDPYSPLFYLVRNDFSKYVGLIIVLTRVLVYSTTARICLISRYLNNFKNTFKRTL